MLFTEKNLPMSGLYQDIPGRRTLGAYSAFAPIALDLQVQSYETGGGSQEKSPELGVRKPRCTPSLAMFLLAT